MAMSISTKESFMKEKEGMVNLGTLLVGLPQKSPIFLLKSSFQLLLVHKVPDLHWSRLA